MRKIAPLGLVIAVILAAVSVNSPKDVNAQGTAGLISSVLNRMDRNYHELRSLRAAISMEKYNAQLHDSDKYNGVVAYVPGKGRSANVRVEWQRPQHEILAVSNGGYTLFRPRLNMAYVGNARSNRAKAGSVLDFLSLSRVQLQSRYEPLQDIYEETLWGGVRTTHLKLVPKGGAGYLYAEVWIDGDGMPVQAKIVEKNDDATTIRLTNLEKNARVSSDEFRIQLDSGVKIVRG